MGSYSFRFDNNPDTASLIYLAEVYHLDLLILLHLYEKYKKDVFFFFYMLSGQQVSVPRQTKLLRITQSSRELSEKVKKAMVTKVSNGQTAEVLEPVGKEDDNLGIKTEQERRVFSKMLDLWDPKDECFRVMMEIAQDDQREIDIGCTSSSRVSNITASTNGADDQDSAEEDGEGEH